MTHRWTDFADNTLQHAFGPAHHERALHHRDCAAPAVNVVEVMGFTRSEPSDWTGSNGSAESYT